MGYYLNRRQDEQYHRKFSADVAFEADIVGMVGFRAGLHVA
jgi:hypothetical protein